MNENRPNGVAPDLGGVRPRQRMRKAWQTVWDGLATTEFRDSYELAVQASKVAGVELSSVITLMHRMAKDGLLDQCKIPVRTQVTRGGRVYDMHRLRTHYRMLQGDRLDAVLRSRVVPDPS